MAESVDPVMPKLRALFEKSKLTLDELGQRMGYEKAVARTSVWQFLNKTADPRLSMIRKFTQAVGVSMEELFAESKQKKRV